MSKEPPHCPRCARKGYSIVREPGTIRLREAVGRRVFVTEWPGRVCPRCGAEDILVPEFARFYERIMDLLLDGLVDEPAVLRKMRHAARLSGAELGGLLGVQRETVSRWETGRMRIGRPYQALLTLLARERREGRREVRELLERLAGGGAKLPRRVKIDVSG
jgi:DNA-binding XRE family transcriptional regulator